jgi:hypothetical protein
LAYSKDSEVHANVNPAPRSSQPTVWPRRRIAMGAPTVAYVAAHSENTMS